MNFKKAILISIAQKGIDRKEFCRLAGITNGYVSEVINGKINPKIDTIERMAAALDLKVSEFIALGE